jgi:DNA-binding GntR family transcriptional regulator
VTTNLTVIEHLRSDILSGELAPGQRLVEFSLCERYECGRIAVRDALTALECEGLVERATNRGATVRTITIDEVIEVTEARAALESLIAGQAAKTLDDAAVPELRSIIVDMRAAVDADDTEGYSELNSVLHRRIREISRHTIGAHLVANLSNRARHHQFRLAQRPGRAAESVEQHAAIVEAIASGDASAASTAMAAHLASAVEAFRDWDDPVS